MYYVSRIQEALLRIRGAGVSSDQLWLEYDQIFQLKDDAEFEEQLREFYARVTIFVDNLGRG